jgi:MFS family permease
VLGAAAAALGTEPVFGAVAAIAGGLAVAAATTPEAGRVVPAGATLRSTLRAPRVPSGMWLVAVPGLGFGVLDVLVPLRMDELGASQAAVAATFLVAAGCEAVVSPIVGRVSDRRGPFVPIRGGLLAAALLVLVVPVAEAALPCAAMLVLTTAALGVFWAPAMALLSDAAEAVGAHQGLAFGLVNLAWASGMVLGAAGGGAIAKATTDAAPYALFAGLCASTLLLLTRRPALVSAR